MKFTLRTNIASLYANRQLTNATRDLESTYTRLSSGLRINKASDDAAGLALSSALDLEARIGSQGLRNINDAISYINTMDASLGALSDILQRISELAQQASNGVLTSTQRETLNTEAQELSKEYERIINTTKFNGKSLFDKENENLNVHFGSGENNSISFNFGRNENYMQQVSSSSSGVDGNGSAISGGLSADGRYAVIRSDGTNLVTGDTNGVSDIFRKDLQTGEILRVSTDASGAQANNGSDVIGISDDGRYILFSSYATNLVAGDTNGSSDVFRKDMETGDIVRISTDSSGAESNGDTFDASISGDGRYVFFESNGSNLVAGDTNGQYDIFRKDLVTGETIRVSTDSLGAEANNRSYIGEVSKDGRYITFESTATNLVASDTNGVQDIFRKDLVTGETVRVSTDSSNSQSNGWSFGGAISSNGRYVMFSSEANNLVSGDGNSSYDVFKKDLVSGEITRISVSNGVEGDNHSHAISASADGRYIIFNSEATNLVSNDTNGEDDIFIMDSFTGEVRRISQSESGAENPSGSNDETPHISADGSTIIFHAVGTNLIDGKVSTADQTYAAINPFFFEKSINPLAGISLETAESAQVSLSILSNYQTEVSFYKARVGSSSTRLEIASSNLESAKQNYIEASNRIKDVDVAQEMAKLVSSQIIQQASSAILAQAKLQSEIVLKLLS